MEYKAWLLSEKGEYACFLFWQINYGQKPYGLLLWDRNILENTHTSKQNLSKCHAFYLIWKYFLDSLYVTLPSPTPTPPKKDRDRNTRIVLTQWL